MNKAKSGFVVQGIRWWLVVVFTLVGPGELTASPNITMESSTSQIRKGDVFKIYLHILSQENMKQFEVSFVPPSGFTAEVNGLVPQVFESGSSYTAVYTVTPPTALDLKGQGRDTREKKIFVINVSYLSGSGDQVKEMRESLELPIDYSTSPIVFMVCGVFGLIFGNFVKTFTGQKASGTPGWQAVRVAFTNGLGGLLTSVAIGFIVLLVLSRETVPAKGWYDSLALGVAVALLSDEQLLAKVKVIIPNGRKADGG